MVTRYDLAALLPKIDRLSAGPIIVADIWLFSNYLFFISLTSDNFLINYTCAFPGFAPPKPGRDDNVSL